MKVPAIAPTVYSNLKSITILPKENAGRTYIFNEVLDLTNKLHTPATFHNNKIEVPTPTKLFLSRLNELGINFNEVV